jgi:FkbM family methyltransferase
MKYSQNNEERIIADYFNGFKGTFLSLGENDGETLSNTRALALKGWNGVCVDASPEAYARLEKLYAGVDAIETHHLALYTRDGWIDLYESGSHLSKKDVALLSSVVEGETKRWAGGTTFDQVVVPAVTFATLLGRSKYKKFDLISMDIEGMDLAVLQQMDLTELGCKMLIVEVNASDPQPYLDHCAKHGMVLYTRNAENLICIR